MIGPVGIQHADLRNRRVPHLFFGKMRPDKLEIAVCHRQPKGIIQCPEAFLIHLPEAFKASDILRLLESLLKGLRLFFLRDPGIHRIAAIIFYSGKCLFSHASPQDINRCGPDQRLYRFIQQSDALNGGIRPLVKLSRQVFHCESLVFRLHGKMLFVQVVHRRLRKNRILRHPVYFIRKIFDIVADEDAKALQIRKPQIASQLTGKVMRLPCERVLLFHKYTSDISHFFTNSFRPIAALHPMACQGLSFLHVPLRSTMPFSPAKDGRGETRLWRARSFGAGRCPVRLRLMRRRTYAFLPHHGVTAGVAAGAFAPWADPSCAASSGIGSSGAGS